MVSTTALHQEGPGFKSQPGVVVLLVCIFSMWMGRFSLGTPASSQRQGPFILGDLVCDFSSGVSVCRCGPQRDSCPVKSRLVVLETLGYFVNLFSLYFDVIQIFTSV
ncbi:hypothetical protein XENORESO_010327 [Xenotaenia resolanae]|uniref:Uncharacterized protein n=1 Tax=Xenotaenia resolanae TaxID=208358 RepID=A0ABV0X2E5_9TELE